jgi:ubiquinone/menaquinone biosynthesis C-methylase UbiE
MKTVAYKILSSFLKYGFRLLYHSMAWTYDGVAAIASAGKWENWIMTALSYIQGPKVLELGFGPGHLQVNLLKQNFLSFGIDESSQMASIAMKNIQKAVHQRTPDVNDRLVRGRVQSLPFADETINTVVSTFPSPYIFDQVTISEIERVLAPFGKIIIVLGAEITGNTLAEKLSAWLMGVTHQSLKGQQEIHVPNFGSNMSSRMITVDLQSSQVFLIEIVKST